MRGTRHSEEQIIAILKQADNGVKTAELCWEETGNACRPKEGGELSDGELSDERTPCLQADEFGPINEAISTAPGGK